MRRVVGKAIAAETLRASRVARQTAAAAAPRRPARPPQPAGADEDIDLADRETADEDERRREEDEERRRDGERMAEGDRDGQQMPPPPSQVRGPSSHLATVFSVRTFNAGVFAARRDVAAWLARARQLARDTQTAIAVCGAAWEQADPERLTSAQTKALAAGDDEAQRLVRRGAAAAVTLRRVAHECLRVTLAAERLMGQFHRAPPPLSAVGWPLIAETPAELPTGGLRMAVDEEEWEPEPGAPRPQPRHTLRRLAEAPDLARSEIAWRLESLASAHAATAGALADVEQAAGAARDELRPLAYRIHISVEGEGDGEGGGGGPQDEDEGEDD